MLRVLQLIVWFHLIGYVTQAYLRTQGTSSHIPCNFIIWKLPGALVSYFDYQ